MRETGSVADVLASRYGEGMALNDTIRARLNEAIAADTKGRRGKPRSPAQIAEEAGIGDDHLRKFLRADSGMDLEKLAAVARVLGRDLLWLLGGSRHLSGLGSEVPAVDSTRYPVDATPEKLPDALRLAAFGSGPNLTEDETAHWIRLEQSFGEYRQGDWLLVSPSSPCSIGNEVAAAASGRLVVGVYRLFQGLECLAVSPTALYAPGEFRLIGPVRYHLRQVGPA